MFTMVHRFAIINYDSSLLLHLDYCIYPYMNLTMTIRITYLMSGEDGWQAEHRVIAPLLAASQHPHGTLHCIPFIIITVYFLSKRI